MTKSYTSSYIKIYFWEGLSFLTKFISLFIVVPYLTSEPAIYGIYTISISLGLFLNYADLGFLRATQKFAAEAYSVGNRWKEMEYLGFGAFILFIFSILLTAVFLYFALYPHALIKGLDTPYRVKTASLLLFILTVFTPFVVLRRTVDLIFKIRLKDFVSKKIFLIGNIITISSVFYFFGNGHYKIVPYFLFLKIIDTLAIVISLWLAKRKYNYNLPLLFNKIHFNKSIFNRTKRLAFSGLYLMITWVLFYEIDKMVIGKFIGAKQTAIYAIALTFPVIFRQSFGVFFTPIFSRVNHFIGTNDNEALKKFILQIIIFSAPLTVLPTVGLAVVAKPFILSWVGLNYMMSINIAVLLALSYTLSFITYSTDIILYAKEEVKKMYIAGSIPVLILWLGVFFTYHNLGLLAFGIFKFLGVFFVQCFYLIILIQYLDISYWSFIKKVFIPLIMPVSFLVLSLSLVTNFLPIEKSKLNLLMVSLIAATAILISFVIQYYTSFTIRIYIKNNIINILKRKNKA